MGVLEFISSLVWPAVVVGALVAFRGSLRSWFTRQPSKVKVGSFEMAWEQSISETVDDLNAVNQLPSDTNDQAQLLPTGVLAVRLRGIARSHPVAAIMDAAGFVEEELEGLARTVQKLRADRRGSWVHYLTVIEREQLLHPYVVEILQSLRKLRNLAAHDRQQVGSTEAFEFIALADIVLSIISPIRQRRELDNL